MSANDAPDAAPRTKKCLLHTTLAMLFVTVLICCAITLALLPHTEKSLGTILFAFITLAPIFAAAAVSAKK